MSDGDEYEFDDDSGAEMEWEPTDDGIVFDRPAAKEKPEVLAAADIMKEVEAAVDDVASVMAWSRTSSLLMLRHCKWSAVMVKEKYFEDPEALVKASGVEDMQDSFTVADASVDCGLCWDTVEAGQSASLSCCHPFCFACWAGHLEYSLKNAGENAVAVKCPQAGCPQFCGRQAYEKIFGVPSKPLDKYIDFVVKSFVNGSERYGECPAPGCSLMCKYPRPRSSILEASAPVPCTCGYTYCFGCLLEDHSPASCADMKLWIKKESDESETANWFVANTKACPGKNCGRMVEKNGGCNHMTCQQCKHDWCWVCEGPWSSHGTSWYQCNQFKEGEKSTEKDKARTQARSELERYIHYYTRYSNHGRSRKLDKVVMLRTQKRIAAELAKSQSQSVIDLDYLNKTAEVLARCRHALQYSYAYAFYLTHVGSKDLFEFNQAMLEHSTEMLSEFIEDTTGAYSKQEVVNRTSTAEKMLQKLQEGCVVMPPVAGAAAR